MNTVITDWCLPSGWNNLVTELDEKLIKIEPDYTIMQAKEKYGGLRYYTNVQTEEAFELVNEYEEKSYTVCEICGEEAELRTINGWMTTLCDKHYKECIE